ncbi:ester cyclase [Sphingomonas psychrolutea]|uniref:SnoaL-like domain-containing protein n=1 Tax=Sphingomonas psychrolutea TaxID=1259676 RepID=A0ABQ1GXC8_9SPHN|nr:ester cyclase [Sphingomonas psychrolutea]GGA51859.1 hypothetical protein GCM10011395_22750 [Sphingomonas psychrolutea]
MIGELAPQAALLRGFAIDFLTSHDGAEVGRIMDPAYRLLIGGFLLDGRDDSYFPATAAQLAQFPGLCVTVHDAIIGTDHVAMRFTEHGASVRDEGRVAAWSGVTLFRIADGRLAEGWAEEDYFARKRQLKSGHCDPIRVPGAAPWDQPALASDAHVEAAVRNWLARPSFIFDPVVDEIVIGGPGFAALLDPSEVKINALFTAGPRAAFHLDLVGTYCGGFDDLDKATVGQAVRLRLAGMVDIENGAIVRAQISGDRLGLHRSLLKRG